MNLCFCTVVAFCAVVRSKNLHVKESHTEKNEALQYQDIFNYDDNVYNVKERFARHVELVTESVLDHLLKEINNKYPQAKNGSHTNIPKMMKRLRMKLKRHIKKKNRKMKKIKEQHKTKNEQDVLRSTF